MSAFFTALAAIPEIIGIIKEVLAIVSEAVNYIVAKQRLSELRDALAHAKETKDTSKLEDFFNPRPRP